MRIKRIIDKMKRVHVIRQNFYSLNVKVETEISVMNEYSCSEPEQQQYHLDQHETTQNQETNEGTTWNQDLHKRIQTEVM